MSVVHHRVINSRGKTSDGDNSPTKKKLKKSSSEEDVTATENQGFLQQAVSTIEQKAKTTMAIEEAKLELARRRDIHEEEDRREGMEVLKRQQACEDEAFKAKEWERAMKMLEHMNPAVQAAGQKLVDKLSQED